MKKINEIDKHKLAIANIVDEVYNKGYERGYSSSHGEVDEIRTKEDVEAGIEHGIGLLRDALLDREFLKANYGCTKVREILMDFPTRDIIEEYYDYKYGVEDKEKPSVCPYVGFICPCGKQCNECELYDVVDRFVKKGDVWK